MAIRISASRIKSIQDCSLKFYYKEILNIPEKIWSQTKIGSAVHSIFECVMRKKRAARMSMFVDIITGKFTLSDWPSIQRYIKIVATRHKIEDKYLEGFESMIEVAFLAIRPYFLNKNNEFVLPKYYNNEEKFQFKIGDAEIKGFIDLLVEDSEGNLAIIDLKSQKNKFTKAELPQNIQALIYQYYVYKQYGKLATVNFILLRHAPTKRTPLLYLQSVTPPTPTHFIGLEAYIKDMHEQVNNFGLEQAYSNPHKDPFFCERVCSFYASPLRYQKVINKTTGAVISTHMLDQDVKLKDNEEIRFAEFAGCGFRNSSMKK